MEAVSSWLAFIERDMPMKIVLLIGIKVTRLHEVFINLLAVLTDCQDGLRLTFLDSERRLCMLNNIKPTWIFWGGVLITMLWALEFDNRPRTRLIIPDSYDHVNSPTVELTNRQSDRVSSLESSEFPVTLGQLAQAGQSDRKNTFQPHRGSFLSDSSRNLLAYSANRQLPAQKHLVLSSREAELVKPFRDNNPLHSTDRWYGFGNKRVNIEH